MEGENPCLQELDILKSIDESIKKFLPQGSFHGTDQGWNLVRVGRSLFYERTVTYLGVAISTDLILPNSFQLNRIEQIWNDTTAKDFSVRVFTGPSAEYTELDTQTANTATSRLVQLGSEYKFPGASKIRIYSGSNTNGKTDTIHIQVDEL